MIKNKKINDYVNKRYYILNEYSIECLYCKIEYSMSFINQHLKKNKRCLDIQIELSIKNPNFLYDKIIFENKISNLRKSLLEDKLNKL